MYSRRRVLSKKTIQEDDDGSSYKIYIDLDNIKEGNNSTIQIPIATSNSINQTNPQSTLEIHIRNESQQQIAYVGSRHNYSNDYQYCSFSGLKFNQFNPNLPIIDVGIFSISSLGWEIIDVIFIQNGVRNHFEARVENE